MCTRPMGTTRTLQKCQAGPLDRKTSSSIDIASGIKQRSLATLQIGQCRLLSATRANNLPQGLHNFGKTTLNVSSPATNGTITGMLSDYLQASPSAIHAIRAAEILNCAAALRAVQEPQLYRPIHPPSTVSTVPLT